MDRKYWLLAGVAVLFLIPLLANVQVDPGGLILSNFLLRGSWEYGNKDDYYTIVLFSPLAWAIMLLPVIPAWFFFYKASKKDDVPSTTDTI
jgi:uncharacterized membrane protein